MKIGIWRFDHRLLRRRITLGVWVGLAAMASTATFAHHSFAMFDRSKIVTLKGTVRELQWTNPHIWIQVLVPNDGGGKDEWSVEGTSPNGLVRQGWTSNSVKAGDKISLRMFPLKSGGKSGSLIDLTLPDGRLLGGPGSLRPGS